MHPITQPKATTWISPLSKAHHQHHSKFMEINEIVHEILTIRKRKKEKGPQVLILFLESSNPESRDNPALLVH